MAPTWLRFSFTDGLVIRLTSNAVANVVEIEKIEKLLAEQKRQTGTAFDRKKNVAIGKIQGATTLITGDIRWHQPNLTVRAKCISVETGEVLSAAEAQGKVNQVNALLDHLLNSLAEEAPAVSIISPSVIDQSTIASQVYYEGRTVAAGGDPVLGKALYSAVIAMADNNAELRNRVRIQNQRTVIANHLGMQLLAQKKRQEAAKTIGRLLGEGYLRSRTFDLGTPTLDPGNNRLVKIPVRGRLEPNFAREAKRILGSISGRKGKDWFCRKSNCTFVLAAHNKDHFMTGWFQTVFYGFDNHFGDRPYQRRSKGPELVIEFLSANGNVIHRHSIPYGKLISCHRSSGGGSMFGWWESRPRWTKIDMCGSDFPNWDKIAANPAGNQEWATDISLVDVELPENTIQMIHSVRATMAQPN